MKLFVYHAPEQTPADQIPDCAVVIDVLRATTTIATALHYGAEAVQVFSDIDELLAVSADWPAENRIRAGERGGQAVPGCDLGNSPLDYRSQSAVAGKRLFMSTTNGTRALQRVQSAPLVVTAAQINRQAAVDFLLAKEPETVWLLGSGWQGAYALEDTVCAGAIADALPEMTPGNDEAVAAVSLWQQWQASLLTLFQQASHGQRLLRLQGDADLTYCAQSDQLDVLPIQTSPGVLIANPA
ncbi:MAG: 2-phosphosulfolactate phosphatase family protein [Cyanobacteria bacterium P01_H01_bin.15]